MPRTLEQDRVYLKAYRAANRDKVRAQARARMKRWQARNLQVVKAKNKANWAKNRERLTAKRRERYWSDPEFRAAFAVWRRANPEKVRAAVKAWIARNPEYKRVMDAMRRARKRGLRAEQIDVAVLAARQKSICAWCLKLMKPSEYTLDHIIPIAAGAKGGASHTYENIQLMHRACNSAKGKRFGAGVQPYLAI